MKYIRTKDGIIDISDYVDKEFYYQCTTSPNYIGKENVIDQGNTIEELCDEFIEYGKRPVVISQVKVMYGRMSGKTPLILGAIWTDKGLIYVAKMNEKGVLELL